MSDKTKFTINGIEFTLTNRHVQTEDYSGKPLEVPTLRMNHSAAASVIKQYVKKIHPNVTCYVSSDSFSMGNSVDVHLTDERGNPAPKEVIKDVDSFGNLFVYGSFNSMEDIYEHRADRDFVTPEGYLVDASLKWLTVTDKPKHSTLPDVYRMLSNMTSPDCTYVFGQCDVKTAVQHAMRFGATKANCEKAIMMMAQ